MTQQTRVVQPILVHCWASIEDDGPICACQQWLNVSCFLGTYRFCDVIDEEHAMCASVEAGSDRPESLLTSCVPLKQKTGENKKKML